MERRSQTLIKAASFALVMVLLHSFHLLVQGNNLLDNAGVVPAARAY